MKKISKYIFNILILALVLNSCEVEKTETLFEESATERINGEINELRSLLLAENQGYSGIYFPNDDVVGGINFHMNFTEDLRVKMTSDFKSTTELTDTRYDISVGTTAAELVFTSGSRHITDLVQDGAAGFDTFFGGNSFQYVGEEDGVLTLREIRSGGKLVLSPSNFTDFETESVISANNTFFAKQSFTEIDCATTSVFDSLAMEVVSGGETINYSLIYDANNIYLNTEIANPDGSATSQGFGLAFTLIGGQSALQISPALEVNAGVFEIFILETGANGNQYIATSNGGTATILNTTLEVPSGEEVNQELPILGPTAFLYRPALGSNPLTSSCFQEQVIDQVNSNLDAFFGPGAFFLSDLQFIFNFDSDDCDNFMFVQIRRASDGENFNAFYCFNRVSISNNRVFQEYTGPFGTGNGPFLEPFLQPLIEFFDNPEATSSGLLYTNEDTFTSDTASFTNPAATFTKMDNPALRIYGLFFG